MSSKILSFLIVVTLYPINSLLSQTLNETSGTGSGVNISTGDYNTMYGDSTGSNLTSGHQTTLIGFTAGKNVTASELTAVGYQAGYSNTTGFDNTFVGWQAGRLTLTGGDNTFIGTESGENNTTGYDNTFVGEESGTANTTGYENTFIGEDAGWSNTTGYKNTFVGNEAGISANVGYRNTAVGSEAMSDVDDGHHNTSIGDSSAIDIGDGIYNTMVGAASGPATEYADFNTFIGSRSGWDNNRTNSLTNANRNTYVGFQSGASNREGEDNVGLGAFSGYGRSYSVLSSGDFWFNGGTIRQRTTFIGAQAIAAQNDVITMGYYSYNEGQYAIGIGNEANMQNAIGAIGIGYQFASTDLSDYSIGIGYQANIAEDNAIGIGNAVNVTSAQTIAIGSQTIAQNDGAIVIGYGAQSNDVIDNTNGAIDAVTNIAIGYNATVSGENAIAIGKRASASNANTMVLGGAVYPLSVGIGTDNPNPLASLDLSGTGKGLLLNRMTTAERTTLQTNLGPTEASLMVFDTTESKIFSWTGSDWQLVEANTDSQDLSLENNNLSISNGATTIDLSSYLDNTDNQDLTLDSNNLSISNGTNSIDLSSYLDNTDNQELTLDTNTLSISNGSNNVDLSSYLDNTDSQELTLTNNSLSITNGNSIDLSNYINTDQQQLTSAVLVGTTLEIAIENGNTVSVELGPMLASLENRVTALENSLNTNANNKPNFGAVLHQNIPNPFNGTTSIGYYLPHESKNAHIVISNNAGQLIQTILLENTGEQEISINSSDLSSGVYFYSMFIDGQKFATRRMIID